MKFCKCFDRKKVPTVLDVTTFEIVDLRILGEDFVWTVPKKENLGTVVSPMLENCDDRYHILLLIVKFGDENFVWTVPKTRILGTVVSPVLKICDDPSNGVGSCPGFKSWLEFLTVGESISTTVRISS